MSAVVLQRHRRLGDGLGYPARPLGEMQGKYGRGTACRNVGEPYDGLGMAWDIPPARLGNAWENAGIARPGKGLP